MDVDGVDVVAVVGLAVLVVLVPVASALAKMRAPLLVIVLAVPAL